MTDDNSQVCQNTSADKDTDWQRHTVENKMGQTPQIPKITQTSQLHAMASHLWCWRHWEWNYRTKTFNRHAVQKPREPAFTSKGINPLFPPHQQPGQRKQKSLWPWRHKQIAFHLIILKAPVTLLIWIGFIFRLFFPLTNEKPSISPSIQHHATWWEQRKKGKTNSNKSVFPIHV